MHNEDLPPTHLGPLMDGTPLALERIKAAWPGLVFADRVYLLSVLLADRNSHPKALIWISQRDALIDFALDDDNAYIRYLAAKRLREPNKSDNSEARARIEKVKADASALVRAAQQEAGTISPPFKLRIPGEHPVLSAISPKYDPAQFWTLDPVYRLAVATWSSWDFSVAEPLRYAARELLGNRGITEAEMADVLIQFLGPDYLSRFSKKEPRAGRSSRHFDHEVEELWKLVPDLPKRLAGILLQCLPGGDDNSPIPSGVLECLDDESLAFLLRRDDVELQELRRRLYVESPNEKLRRAAVTGEKFKLLDSDLSKLFLDAEHGEDSRERSVPELSFLAEFCRGAGLVQMEAIRHYLCHWKTNYYRTDEGDDLQSERAKRLWNTGTERSNVEQELLQLRVFELAKVLSPMGSGEAPPPIPKFLKQHQKLITLKNPWQTYLNLWLAVGPMEWKRVREDLPRVWIRNFDVPA